MNAGFPSAYCEQGRREGYMLEAQGRNRDEFRIRGGQPDLMEQAEREHETA